VKFRAREPCFVSVKHVRYQLFVICHLDFVIGIFLTLAFEL
jgi:hypothetical protein